MAVLDIRKLPESQKIHRIIFADDNRDGLGKACYVEDAFPHQCNIISRDGASVVWGFIADGFVSLAGTIKDLM